MKQVIVIHGGNSYENYEEYLKELKAKDLTIDRLRSVSWKENLQKGLGENFDVLTPRMPNMQNAKYLEWKIWFEKIINLLDEEVILIGHSLGGIFILKYLSENNYPKKIKATFLIAAPYSTPTRYPLSDFVINTPLGNFIKQAGKVFIFHSRDDLVVPFDNSERFKKDIPNAQFVVFEDKGHFNDSQFSELVEELRKL